MLQAAKISYYLQAMAKRGFSSDAVLAESGLTAAQVDKANTSIGLAQAQLVIRNMLNLSNNRALGFELGAEVTASDMGVVGHGMLASPTFRDTIQLWSAYAPSLYGTLITNQIHEAPDRSWSLEINAELPSGESYQFCLEEYLALILNMGEQLCGRPINVRQLDLSYPAPRHQALYKQLFNSPVYFNAKRNEIHIAWPLLDDFIETRDEYLYGVYQRFCERQSNRLAEQGSFTQKVHNYLLKSLGHPPTLALMAKQQGISASTLKRRLKEEGHSFRDLLNGFRRDFALEHFKTTTLTAQEVAYLLGYRDTKPFLRAFKLWTGLTVGQYRQKFGLSS